MKKIVTALLLNLPEDLTGQSRGLEPSVKLGASEGAQSNTMQIRGEDSDKFGI